MAYATGTATDYKDLLDKLRLFASTNAALVAAGQAWTVLRYDNTSSDHELIMRGPGLAGNDEIFVGIKTEAPGNGAYNWRMQGFSGYSALAFDANPGAFATPASCPRLLLLNAGMTYWFFVNGRRIIVVAKASTTYQVGYLGLILPYGAPSSLPYPLFIGGQGCTNTVWSDTVYTNSPFWIARATAAARPAVSSGLFMSGGTWKNTFQKRYASPNWYFDYELFVWPQQISQTSLAQGVYLDRLRKNVDGSVHTFPMILCASGTSRNMYGEFDGMDAVSGFELAAEDTITIGSDTYIVFSGGSLSERSAYVAIKAA